MIAWYVSSLSHPSAGLALGTPSADLALGDLRLQWESGHSYSCTVDIAFRGQQIATPRLSEAIVLQKITVALQGAKRRSLNLHENNELRLISYADRNFNIICMDTGLGSSLVQVRVPDKSGEITKAYASDVESQGREARKVRVLKQIEGIQELQNLRIAIEGIEPDLRREGRSFDRLTLSSWSHPSGHVLLIGDAAHAMYPGPGQGAGTAYEDAHQLSVLLHKAFSTGSSALETAVPDAVRRYVAPQIRKLVRIAQSLKS